MTLESSASPVPADSGTAQSSPSPPSRPPPSTPSQSPSSVPLSKKTGRFASKSFMTKLDIVIEENLKKRKKGGFKTKNKKRKKDHRGYRRRKKSSPKNPKKSNKSNKKTKKEEIPWKCELEDIKRWESNFCGLVTKDEDVESVENELYVCSLLLLPTWHLLEFGFLKFICFSVDTCNRET